ncbi:MULTISPECIES: peptidase inhibitor family I36 protein [unclassified Crossiella]|uniref:peptidase inhibitor family I36 protein n=1 Tax=unclassified Crossiella TaxID=2620835 RepID=UPI0020004321|nr:MULTISPECIES: peptidase inhibitor family I36 protein [unclassified Crossiella]MCK2238524.1 peptidase inhibitor family I36 protein [Crossiella sp. S99.2]MCK2251906.1 peptidase inhibitor family I36 protein [Crossiella sp. S99.1]
MRKSVSRTTRLACTVLAFTVLAVTALAGSTLAGSTLAGTAAAAPGSPCPHSGALCLWDQANYQGNPFNVRALDPAVGTCVDLFDHKWGEGRAKSGFNNGARTASLFTSRDCTGRPYPIDAGSGHPNIPIKANSVYVY